MKETKKTSKLIFDMKLVRKLLKLNGEIKFCPYCGKSMAEKCDCHKNIVVDVKPYRNEDGVLESDRSVMVFQNNEAFQNDLTQIIDEIKAKKDSDGEQLTMDLD
jgi:hypothetical protein